MAKVLITGINGFAGSHLVEHLLAKGDQISGTVLPGTGLANLGSLVDQVSLTELDITDFNGVKKVLIQEKPEQVYHLAAVTSVFQATQKPSFTFDVNVGGTLNLLEAVRDVALDPTILLIGSSEMYGDVPISDLPVEESYPLKPLNHYAISKASVEMIAYQYHRVHNLKIVRTRSFNHAGPRQADCFVISSFAKQVAQIEKNLKDPVLSVGNLEAKRDFTDVRDMVRAYALLASSNNYGEVFNVCSGQAYKIEELLNKLLALSSTKINCERKIVQKRPSDIPISLGDNSKIKTMLNWQPKITFEQTLIDTLNYWRGCV